MRKSLKRKAKSFEKLLPDNKNSEITKSSTQMKEHASCAWWKKPKSLWQPASISYLAKIVSSCWGWIKNAHSAVQAPNIKILTRGRKSGKIVELRKKTHSNDEIFICIFVWYPFSLESKFELCVSWHERLLYSILSSIIFFHFW